jgi:hypothetical protein
MENKFWCSVSLKDENLRAQVVRMGRGKFKIVSEQNARDMDRIIDTSDLIYYDTETPLEQDSKFESLCKEILSLSQFIRSISIAISLGAVVASHM